MKRIIALIMCISTLISLASCQAQYVSKYKAKEFVRSNTKSHCSAEFRSLDGSYVFKLKKTDGGEGDIAYTSSLSEGEINVYYDIYGTKELLFNICAGEELDARGGYIESGRTVYIIIETVVPSRGSVYIDIN